MKEANAYALMLTENEYRQTYLALRAQVHHWRNQACHEDDKTSRECYLQIASVLENTVHQLQKMHKLYEG